jgi:Cu-Zn family superoxide dismutase
MPAIILKAVPDWPLTRAGDVRLRTEHPTLSFYSPPALKLDLGSRMDLGPLQRPAIEGSDMKNTVLAALVMPCITSAVAPAWAQSAGEPNNVPLIGLKGDSIGKVLLRGGPSGSVLRITIAAGGLAPGWHGIHLHTVGDCSDHGQFQHSKGHVNHGAKKHGLLNPEGPDDGDLANVFANADGSVNAEVSSPSPLAGAQGLLDADGSALVIHANEDDHSSQPIGNAGARIACAVVK